MHASFVVLQWIGATALTCARPLRRAPVAINYNCVHHTFHLHPLHPCACTHAHMCMPLCMHTCTHVHLHTLCICAHAHAHKHTCTCSCAHHICMHAHAHACMHMCTARMLRPGLLSIVPLLLLTLGTLCYSLVVLCPCPMCKTVRGSLMHA